MEISLNVAFEGFACCLVTIIALRRMEDCPGREIYQRNLLMNVCFLYDNSARFGSVFSVFLLLERTLPRKAFYVPISCFAKVKVRISPSIWKFFSSKLHVVFQHFSDINLISCIDRRWKRNRDTTRHYGLWKEIQAE